MKKNSNYNKIKSLLVSFIFTGALWLLINNFIMEIPFWKYFLLELGVAVSHIISIFVKNQLGIIVLKSEEIV